jgi:hypothetical protein
LRPIRAAVLQSSILSAMHASRLVWPAARAPVFRYNRKGPFAEAQPPGGLLKSCSHFLLFMRDE